MLATALTWIVAALVLLAALCLMLWPLTLISGVWAHWTMKREIRAAQALERVADEP